MTYDRSDGTFDLQFHYSTTGLDASCMLEFLYSVLQFCEQDLRCNRLKLTDLLIAPMHHWTRLPLILDRVRKYTRDSHDVLRLDDSISKVVSSLSKYKHIQGLLFQ